MPVTIYIMQILSYARTYHPHNLLGGMECVLPHKGLRHAAAAFGDWHYVKASNARERQYLHATASTHKRVQLK